MNAQKEKKLSVTHYVNKSLKPKYTIRGTEEYPLYIKLIYNTKTMLFKSRLVNWYVSDESVNNDKYTIKQIGIEIDLIKSIIEKSKWSDFDKDKFYKIFGLSTMNIQELFRNGAENNSSNHEILNTVLSITEENNLFKNRGLMDNLIRVMLQEFLNTVLLEEKDNHSEKSLIGFWDEKLIEHFKLFISPFFTSEILNNLKIFFDYKMKKTLFFITS